MSTPPSKALVSDLQVAIRRLARRGTVMNLGLLSGGPLLIVDELVRPVAEQAALVHDLIQQAIAADVDLGLLRVQIAQPISDDLAEIFAALVDSDVPDSLEGLL